MTPRTKTRNYQREAQPRAMARSRDGALGGGHSGRLGPAVLRTPRTGTRTGNQHPSPIRSSARRDLPSGLRLSKIRSTAHPFPSPTPTTPVGGRFAHRAHPLDVLPRVPNWIRTTTKQRKHQQLLRPSSILSAVTGRRCPLTAGTAPLPVPRRKRGSRCRRRDAHMVTLSMDPQINGSLRGVQTVPVVSNECGIQGQVPGPFVATRTGDLPRGVSVADPATVTATPATSPPPFSPIAGQALDGIFRLDYDYAKQTVNGVTVINPPPNDSTWWAFRSVCMNGCVATGSGCQRKPHHARREGSRY